MHVEQAGAGEPVVLLHGWGTSAKSLAPVMETLSATFTVWAFDFPGHGLTANPTAPWGVTDFADFVRHAMARLGVERAHLLGHSHGGRVSIRIAAQTPHLVAGLVLVDSAGIRPQRTAGLRLRGWTARSGRRILGHQLAGRAGQQALAALYGKLGMSDYRDAGPMRATFVKVVNEDLSALLPSVQAPTLIIWGALDRETPLWMGEQMTRQIPDSRLVVLPAAGHYAYLDDRPAFDREVIQFLTGGSFPCR